jgi:hypothetical protein
VADENRADAWEIVRPLAALHGRKVNLAPQGAAA